MTRSLSVIVPVLDEEGNLEGVVRELGEVLAGHDHEILIVNDGSRDGTAVLADRLAATNPEHVRVFHHATNRGGGAATRTGLAAATKELVTMVPGDGQFVAADLPRFLSALGDREMVISRRNNRSGGLVRALNSWAYRTVVRALLGIQFSHINWVKLYRREPLQALPLSSESWLLDTEILYWATRLGWRSAEIDVEELPRLRGTATGGSIPHMLHVVRELWRFRQRVKSMPAPGSPGEARS